MLVRVYCTVLLEYYDLHFACASYRAVCWSMNGVDLLHARVLLIAKLQSCSEVCLWRQPLIGGGNVRKEKGDHNRILASLMPTMHPLKPGNVSSKEFSPQPIKRNESLVSGSSLLGKVDRLPQQKGNPSRVIKDWNLA